MTSEPLDHRQWIRDTLAHRLQDVMDRGGGYILEPGITLQVDVPLENLLALVEAPRT